MFINRLFLGSVSEVDVSTDRTPEQIKLFLTENFQSRRPDHFSMLSSQVVQSSSMLSFTARNDKVKIFFSKYPAVRLTGNLNQAEQGTRFIGSIGVSNWVWMFHLGWIISILTAYCQNVLTGTRPQDHDLLLILLLLGLLITFNTIFRLRKAAKLMNSELEKFFDSLKSRTSS